MIEETKEKESETRGKIIENVIESETESVTEDTSLQEERIQDQEGKKSVTTMTGRDVVIERVLTAKGIIEGLRAIALKGNLEEAKMQKAGIEEVVLVMKEIEIEEIEAGIRATQLRGKIKIRYIV